MKQAELSSKQAELSFAKRFDGVTGSAIRDILKLLGVPGMVSFAGGNPSESALQDELLTGIAHDVLHEHGKRLLQYGATEGWPAYREQAAAFLRDDIGLDIKENELLPTTGSTQAIDVLLKAMIDEGDAIIVEGPSFLGTLQAMKLYGAKLVPVPMEDDGLELNALEDAIRANKPKILYTVPNFQNPTGVTLSLAKRKAIVAMAERYNFLIAEDDPYRGLRYAGTPLPSMFSFDETARVVYLTSFSKLISPGMRMGAAVTKNPTLLRKMTIGKQSSDVHTPTITMAMCAEYLRRGLLAPHVADILPRYREQLDHMIAGFKSFPEGIRFTKPEGGLFVWVELPEQINALKLLDRAIAKGVAFVPGTHFYANGGHNNTLRLNFSASEVDKIDEGMERLRQAVVEEMK